MAGEALPWLLRRTLDMLNELDILPQNFHFLSQYALRALPGVVFVSRPVKVATEVVVGAETSLYGCQTTITRNDHSATMFKITQDGLSRVVCCVQWLLIER